MLGLCNPANNVMKAAHAEAWLVFLFVLLDASKSFNPRFCGRAGQRQEQDDMIAELSGISVARHCRQSCCSSRWTSWNFLRLACAHHAMHDRSKLPHRPDVCAIGHCVEECTVNRQAFASLLGSACMCGSCWAVLGEGSVENLHYKIPLSDDIVQVMCI